jgi:hypothetical protein
VAWPPKLVGDEARCPDCFALVAEQLTPTAVVIYGRTRFLYQRLADGARAVAPECGRCGTLIHLTVETAEGRLAPLGPVRYATR